MYMCYAGECTSVYVCYEGVCVCTCTCMYMCYVGMYILYMSKRMQ